MTTNQPKTYDQALNESFAEYVANTGGRSEYMKPDFDAGFSAGYKAALHDRERGTAGTSCYRGDARNIGKSR